MSQRFWRFEVDGGTKGRGWYESWGEGSVDRKRAWFYANVRTEDKVVAYCILRILAVHATSSPSLRTTCVSTCTHLSIKYTSKSKEKTHQEKTDSPPMSAPPTPSPPTPPPPAPSHTPP